ncbi:unnamed protein product [Ixodes pacificus]
MAPLTSPRASSFIALHRSVRRSCWHGRASGLARYTCKLCSVLLQVHIL